jgi:hypothetical protein
MVSEFLLEGVDTIGDGLNGMVGRRGGDVTCTGFDEGVDVLDETLELLALGEGDELREGEVESPGDIEGGEIGGEVEFEDGGGEGVMIGRRMD